MLICLASWVPYYCFSLNMLYVPLKSPATNSQEQSVKNPTYTCRAWEAQFELSVHWFYFFCCSFWHPYLTSLYHGSALEGWFPHIYSCSCVSERGWQSFQCQNVCVSLIFKDCQGLHRPCLPYPQNIPWRSTPMSFLSQQETDLSVWGCDHFCTEEATKQEESISSVLAPMKLPYAPDNFHMHET